MPAMNTLLRLSLAAFFAATATPALACSLLPPEQSFVRENDRNDDERLSPREWQNAQAANYFVDFTLGALGDFRKLDANRDHFLDYWELTHLVRYRQDPCAEWERQFRDPPPAPPPEIPHPARDTPDPRWIGVQ